LRRSSTSVPDTFQNSNTGAPDRLSKRNFGLISPDRLRQFAHRKASIALAAAQATPKRRRLAAVFDFRTESPD
jgi:hypothetical protein